MSKTFNNIMKSIGDNFINEGRRFLYEMGFFNRPIGIISKNYGFIRNTLFRNIGNGFHNFDGYGSPIGTLADVEMNAWSQPPWFFIDMKKNATSNYLEYINGTYFNGNGIVNNFVDADVKTSFFDYNSLLLENAKVGAVRYYDIDIVPDSINGDNVQTNPNAPFDTKLGTLNNFYLNATLYNSRNVYEQRLENNNSITSGVYSNFGFDGNFGMENGDIHTINGRVLTQSELIGDYIPWSTTDHTYDSYVVGGGGQGNLNTVQNIFNLSTDKDLSIHYTDNSKNTSVDNLYYPFGNFYSITYSLGLTSSSGYKTREFIAKSMLGYDLLGNDYVDVEFNNIDSYTPKKYYVGNGTRGSNYIDAMSGTDVEFIKYGDENSNQNIVRMLFPDMGNDSLWSTRALYTYAEAEGNSVPSTMGNNANTFNDGIEYGRHITYNSSTTSEKKDIVYYTNKRFQEGKYDTLISRFHSNEIGLDGSRGNRDMTSTSVSKYGMSHGRNLLKTKPTNENGYDNPYCRVWTYHHQYSTLKDVIRPFNNLDLNVKLEDTGIYSYRTTSGLTKLLEHGVKGKNGLVNISPTKEEPSVKRCMFSIENLAWKGEKDFFKGREDQKGPLGGRIMWFPPYDLKFNENVNVSWSSNQFIGRGESIYTYTNTERSGTLSFKLLIDHPSIVNQWRGEVRGGEGIGDVDDIDSNEQQLLRFFAGCELLAAQKPEVNNEPKITSIQPKVKDVKTTVTSDELVFYVFYPNNYSGVDDDADGIVKPMEYLINGIGPNKYIHEETKTGNKRIEDYGTRLDKPLYGYEMGNGGISTTSKTSQDGFDKYEILTNKNGVNIGYQYCQTNKAGKPNFWAYRCDKAYENQVLHTYNGSKKINYYDYEDDGLNNTIGYVNLTQAHTNDVDTLSKGRLFSFADVFCALQPEAKTILNGKYDEDQVNIISDILGINKEGYNIVSIEVNGFASSHGYNSANNVLSDNRGKSVVKWLKKCYPKKFSIDATYGLNEIGEKLSNYNVNSFIAKIWRCSRVAIKVQKEEIVRKSEIIDMPLPNDSGFTNITYADNMVANEIQKSRSLAEITKPNNLYDLSLAYVNQYGQHLTNVQLNATVNQIENNKAESEAEAMSAKTNGNTIEISNNEKYGYRHEYEFFNELENEAPFLHRKLVQKLKYFDPAFHSITPEGFQSRLTFLHQCTRQGNTSSASDTNDINRNASNLAFGRPPICVLRIGDFYNTKIIIESLTIDYDDTTWDLNDEGIGVMPMMANVNISFKFLGGSDLTGPINRLQNALSFNHYANTSVYDNRAEEVVYDNEGKIIDFRYKPE